jgi:hypothetical protein
MKTEWYTENGIEWIKDENGNRCSVRHFGSKDEAEKALLSLKNCKDCINCSYCSDCYDCSRCSYCSGCYDCSDCSYCSRCSRCSYKKGDCPEIPKIENIHQKVYEAASQDEALNMGDWHTCETVHCWAGWVVHLAGEKGKELEEYFNTPLAAQLIYRDSNGYKINPCWFFDMDGDKALERMKKLADEERGVLKND